jgi:hypothetical protein
MIRKLIGAELILAKLAVAGVLSVAAVSQASAWNDLTNGVWGHKSNDTGGIIPWTPENEKNAFAIAEANCRSHNKYPLATSIHRVPGDYMAYKCVWDPPRRVRARRIIEEPESITVDK